MEILNGYNSGTDKDRLNMFALRQGFGSWAIKQCRGNLPQTYPCCHGNENLEILTQN